MARTLVTDIKQKMSFEEDLLQKNNEIVVSKKSSRIKNDFVEFNVGKCAFTAIVVLAMAVFLYLIVQHVGIRKLIWSFAVGCAVTLLTWMVTYMDSFHPGVNPPTPLSPLTLRERSGHTFHLAYIIAIVNGILVCILSLWWQFDEMSRSDANRI